MDKLCIHQTDDKMKEVGILGLGAFVQQSDKLRPSYGRFGDISIVCNSSQANQV